MECRVENNGGHRTGQGKEFVGSGEQVDSNFLWIFRKTIRGRSFTYLQMNEAGGKSVWGR